MDSWDVSNLSGTQYFYLDYKPKDIYNATIQFTGGIDENDDPNYANIGSCSGSTIGNFNTAYSILNNKDYSVSANYYATYPAQIGIGGYVLKTLGGSGAYIFNSSGKILVSENAVSFNEYDFTTLKQPIIIGIKSGAGVFYNSSLLFSELGVIAIPTATPTSTPNPNPNSTVNGFFHFYDYSTNLDLKNVSVGYCSIQTPSWCTGGYTNNGGIVELDNLPANVWGSLSAGKTGYISIMDERHYPFKNPTTGVYNAVEYLSPIGGITPTPTITATPSITATTTPQPTQTIPSNQNPFLTITVKDQLNSSLISNVGINFKDTTNTSKPWLNVTAYGGSITFSASYNPNDNTQLIRGHLYTISLVKAGYVTETDYNQLLQDASGYGYMLMPATYTPTGGYITLQIQLWDTSTNLAISKPLSGTIKITNQSSIWNNTYNNPQYGLASFTGITPAQGYKVDINLEGYMPYIGYYTGSSSQAGTIQYFYANLVPSTILPSSYILTVNPSAGTFNDTYNLVITGDLSNAKSIIFKFSSPIWNPTLLQVGSYYTSYQLVGGVWKIWDGSAWQTSSLPQSINVKFPSSTGGNDVYTISAYITSSTDQSYVAIAKINLISAGKIAVSIVAYDMDNLLPTSGQISDFTSYVLDVYQNVWYNHTYTVSDFNNAYLYLSAGTEIYYYGSSQPTYADTALKYEYIDANNLNKIEYDFMKNINIFGATNVTIRTHVTDVTGNPIIAAKVVYSDGQICYTSDRGSCTITGLNNSYYSSVVSAYGYASGTGHLTASTLVTNNVIEIVLIKAIPTISIYPTINATTIPTIVTPAAWNDQNATVCGANSTNFIDYAKNLMACNGLNTGLSQSLGLAAIIIIIFVLIGSWKGAGIGAAIGGVIGFILSFALGLIPFVILALLIVLLILITAVLMFGKTPTG
jgi:hypothetical protein